MISLREGDSFPKPLSGFVWNFISIRSLVILSFLIHFRRKWVVRVLPLIAFFVLVLFFFFSLFFFEVTFR